MEKKDDLEQLDMGLKEPVSNKFKNIKYKTEFFFLKLRTNSIFVAPFLWILSSLTASLILVQAYYYKNFLSYLPREIPLFLIAKNPELRLVEKEYLLGILILSICLSIFSVIIAIKNYYRFKIISIFIMTNLTFGIFLLTISLIKIFGIYIF